MKERVLAMALSYKLKRVAKELLYIVKEDWGSI
jgi:hypothetical protein